jgi:hypothetical protein
MVFDLPFISNALLVLVFSGVSGLFVPFFCFLFLLPFAMGFFVSAFADFSFFNTSLLVDSLFSSIVSSGFSSFLST